jgi:hypothetical protein
MSRLSFNTDLTNSINLYTTTEGEFYRLYNKKTLIKECESLNQLHSPSNNLTDAEYQELFNKAYNEFIEFFTCKKEELNNIIDIDNQDYYFYYNFETGSYTGSQQTQLNDQNKVLLNNTYHIDIDTTHKDIQVFKAGDNFYISDRTQDKPISYIVNKDGCEQTRNCSQELINEVVNEFYKLPAYKNFETITLMDGDRELQKQDLTIELDKDIVNQVKESMQPQNLTIGLQQPTKQAISR